MQFAPFKSFVDASFFHELSNRKLNELKLSEHQVPIHGTYSPPLAPNRTPSLQVSGSSFELPGATTIVSHPPQLFAPGFVTNANTIESFKDMDKSALLKSDAARILAYIEDGEVYKNPSLLSSFHIVSFSDLKKYKFHYWFAFPAISLTWTSEPPVTPTQTEIRSINDALVKFRDSESPNHWGFFLLRTTASGDFEAAPLTDHETFWASVPNDQRMVGFADPCSVDGVPGWPLRNFLVFLSVALHLTDIKILSLRDHAHLNSSVVSSFWIHAHIDPVAKPEALLAKVSGWERNSNNKLTHKMTDLGALINPRQLADQAVDLNLKLMKWRIAPSLDLDIIKNSSCLLLGAGTLGSYIARGLLGWGVRKITLVDSGKVSFSNPVRQPLYRFEDCLDGGAPKAARAAAALKEIYPSVDSEGYEIEIPMAGHPVTNEERQKADYDKLVQLIEQHDVVFLLMDSRESRWLPTVIASATGKLVINVALGFDSYVVMRHGVYPQPGEPPHLGCYFCNDVVAPMDSISRQTLDQMCTVTRPGVAMFAAASAVELLASILQHPLKGLAPVAKADDAEKSGDSKEFANPLSNIPHQLRGFLHNFESLKIWGPSYSNCSACSAPIIGAWQASGWEFVKQALDDPEVVNRLSGLSELRRQIDEAEIDGLGWSASDGDGDDL